MKQLILKYQNGGRNFDRMNFGLAFNAARKAGLKTFKWRGRSFGTRKRSEINLPLKISMDSIQMPGLTFTRNSEQIGPTKLITDTRNFKRTLGATDEYGHKFTLPQAQQVIDESGHKGGMWVEDDNGKVISRIGEGLNGVQLKQGYYSNDNTPIVGAGLNEVVVTGHRTHIKPNSSGYLPVKKVKGTNNLVYQNMKTGEYFMVDKRNNQIIANSPDERVLKDPSLWLNYHTGLNGDTNQSYDSFANMRGAEIAATDRNARLNQAMQIQDRETGRRLLHNITQALEKGAQRLNALGTIANHAIFGSFLPGYVEGFGFKLDSKGNWDWYGPNQQTVTGLGGRIGKTLNLFGVDTSGALGLSLMATGDVAGNAVLMEGLTKGTPTRGTLKELQYYNIHGQGTTNSGFGGNRGQFMATTAFLPELTTQMWNSRPGSSYVTIPTSKGASYSVGVRPTGGWNVRQNINGFGGRFVKNKVIPIYKNKEVTIPGSSGKAIGYSPRDNYSGILPMPKLQYDSTPYTVEYNAGKPNSYVEWKFRNGLFGNPYGGGTPKDISQSSNVNVNYSSGDVNKMRSQGRTGNTNKRPIISRLSTGNTDNSNK